MKGMFVIMIAVRVALGVAWGGAAWAQEAVKTEPSGEPYDWKKTGKPERPWLLPYHQTIVMKMSAAQPAQQALDVLRQLDNITCGIPKIMYLVGWQFNGGDTGYPSWAVVNKVLKRPDDSTAAESLRWLIREGRKYNTAVSLHVNMRDAYEDSPLWADYVKNDIVYKNKDGSIQWGMIWGGRRSAPISFYQEWKTGFAQERIDGLLTMLPELKESKTIHIDAFHTIDPKTKQPDPLLAHGFEKEAETQRKIFRYFRDRGIDVTSEFVKELRTEDFAGLQPFAWWFYDNAANYPPEMYCGTPMQAEGELGTGNPVNWTSLLKQFCLKALPWYYKNNKDADKNTQKMWQGEDICMPALWKKDKTLIAYSDTGYENKIWELPPDWKDVKRVSISTITVDGLKDARDSFVDNGKLSLTMKRGEAVAISPRT